MKYTCTPFLLIICLLFSLSASSQTPVFNVKDYGASGKKEDNARPAIQQAIDACSASGGGTVYFPPGAYTSGAFAMKSNITLLLEAGATLYASRDTSAYKLTKSSGYGEGGVPVLIYGKDLQNISITGKGTIDGQAEHTWEALKGVDNFISSETENARKAGVPMERAYTIAPRLSLVYLVDCRNIHIENITLQWSPHWTLHVAHSKEVFIRGIRLFSDLEKGVNADGIDIDGCSDVMISDCHIATGDDAICLKSTNRDGRYTSCENITVTNCTLTSSSAALKIGTETFGDFKNIVFSNCVISNSNRAIGIFVRDGGMVDHVIFSNLTIECKRKHFNWWGSGDAIRFVILKRRPGSKLGSIHNILIKDVMAHVQGTSLIAGHGDKNIGNISLSNVQLLMNPESLPDKRATHALQVNGVTNLHMTDVRVQWDTIATEKAWQSALHIAKVGELTIEGFKGRQGLLNEKFPAIDLQAIGKGVIRNSSTAPGTTNSLFVDEASKKGIHLFNNEFTDMGEKAGKKRSKKLR